MNVCIYKQKEYESRQTKKGKERNEGRIKKEGMFVVEDCVFRVCKDNGIL
jgi:hypothetical protein